MEKVEKRVSNTLKEGEPDDHEIIGRRFQVQFDIAYDGAEGTTPIGTSKTIPDMNLTVKQLLVNHTRDAEGNEHVKKPLYFGVEIPRLTDITDVDRYKETLQERLADINQFIEDEKQSKLKQEAEAKKTPDEPNVSDGSDKPA